MTSPVDETPPGPDAPPRVYIDATVATEVFEHCVRQAPLEALGKLLGHDCEWEGRRYLEVVAWVTGDVAATSTSARLTADGVRECEDALDARFPDPEQRPREVGLFHSHPFGTDPHFSAVDHATFLSFPYDRPGNAFVLIDPYSRYFKTYVLERTDDGKILRQVPWATVE